MTFYRIWPDWIASFITIFDLICVCFHNPCFMYMHSVPLKTKQHKTQPNTMKYNERMKCANFLLILLFFTYLRRTTFRHADMIDSVATTEYFYQTLIKSNWSQIRVRVRIGVLVRFLNWFCFHLFVYFSIGSIKTTLSLAPTLWISKGCRF